MSYKFSPNSFVDLNNSTSANLGVGGVFTGTSTDIKNVSSVAVSVQSDVASAVDGLCIEQSADNNHWHWVDVYSIDAGAAKVFTIPPHLRYFRIVYTNGAVPTTDFEISVIMKGSVMTPSGHRIQDPITDDDDAQLVKSILTGKQDNGNFDNASLTNRGNFKVAVQEYGDTPSIDAFDRLRVSENFTIFDSKQLHDKQPLFWDESLGGSATSVHSTVNADVRLTLTANAADFAIRQTKQRFNYQPGKSQLVFMTFASPQVSGMTKRIGYFDGTGANNLTPNNGIFFQCDGSISWNIAKNGSTTETVTQANWNVDPMDGTGPSEKVLDMDGPQIAIIDFEWLGIGRVRVGFVIDGIIYYVHYFNHANDSSFPTVYMSSPNLPLRYDVQTDGTNGGYLDHICSSVISEGGLQETGILRGVDSGDALITGYASPSVGSTYALLGLRLKAAYADVTVIPQGVRVVCGSSDTFKWSLHLNPTVSGAFAYNSLVNSSLEYARGVVATTITGVGTVLAYGGASGDTGVSADELQTALRLGSTIAGVQDELVLGLTPLTTNLSQWSAINFRELI
jgi:hypothetical protein